MIISPKTVLFIVGPTAVGKSQLALNLAQAIGGEIISADSMQIYRGMDIGTGKPTKKEQSRVRHHLIDIFSPARTFSVIDFYKRAVAAIFEIQQRKKIPIIVGGTGFYVRVLLQGLETSPPPDTQFRKKLEQEFKKKGLSFLVKRLIKSNSKKAERVDLKNPRRVIRALEVLFVNKKFKGVVLPSLKSLGELGMNTIVIGLKCDRGELYRRIDERVADMFSQGWIQEVKKMAGCRFSKTAKQAIGYSRILPMVRNKSADKPDISQLLAGVQRDTRRYAKRQLTWFFKEKVDFWVEASEPGMEGGLCQSVQASLKEISATLYPQ